MNGLLLSIVLLGVGQNLDDLVAKLDHEEFLVREKATEELCSLVIIESEPIVINRMTQLSQSGSLEQKWRAGRVVARYYALVDRAALVPIWSMPKQYRFKKKEDIAWTYYQIASAGESLVQKTNSKTMKLATFLYFRHALENRTIKRKELEDLLTIMEVYYVIEQTIIYTCPSYFYAWPNQFKETVPKPVEERLRELIEKVDVTDKNSPDYPDMVVDSRWEEVEPLFNQK